MLLAYSNLRGRTDVQEIGLQQIRCLQRHRKVAISVINVLSHLLAHICEVILQVVWVFKLLLFFFPVSDQSLATLLHLTLLQRWQQILSHIRKLVQNILMLLILLYLGLLFMLNFINFNAEDAVRASIGRLKYSLTRRELLVVILSLLMELRNFLVVFY